MATVSAGILLYRRNPRGEPEVFLVHPGGPFFRGRDAGVWSIPKGELEPGEEPLAAALRELEEEVGVHLSGEAALPLGQVRQRSGKIVHAWALEVPAEREIEVRSNTFEMEWPPGSGIRRRFPEVDRGAFFGPREARERINPAQAAFLERLEAALRG